MYNSNLAYQEDTWEELIGGKIVAMSPRPAINHHRVALRIVNLFENYLDGKSCTAFSDGVDLFLTEEDHFIPDMMVVCDQSKIKKDGIHGAPDLVVEVLSPRTAKYDRGHKKDVYEACGVREYWIVSPRDKVVEQYLLRDGKLALEDIFTVYPDWELARMTEEERTAVVTRFKCSLFDDLELSLEDIFRGTFPDLE